MNFNLLDPTTWFENKTIQNNVISNEMVQNGALQEGKFSKIPVDIIERILLYLGITELKNVSQCKNDWTVLLDDNVLWRNIRLKLECLPPSALSEKAQVKVFLHAMRERAVKCYYHNYVEIGFQLLRADEEKVKKKEAELIAKSSSSITVRIGEGISSLFSKETCQEPAKICLDPTKLRIYACVYSEDIEVINRLRKAIDLIKYLGSRIGTFGSIEITNKVTPILTAETFAEEHFNDDKFGSLERIESDSWAGKTLTSLPQQFGKLCNLHTLDLSHNNFTSFPLVIIELKKLKELDLSHNYITYVPEEIWGMVKMGTLKINLYNNPLKLTSEQEEMLTKQGPLTGIEQLKADVERAKHEMRVD